MKVSPFEEWWSANRNKSRSERNKMFMALTEEQRHTIKTSLFEDGWGEFFLHNHISKWLDRIKEKHDIDLIELRIQAIKNNKSFIINKKVWNIIQHKILFYDECVNTYYIFGGLDIKPYEDTRSYLVKRDPNTEN